MKPRFAPATATYRLRSRVRQCPWLNRHSALLLIIRPRRPRVGPGSCDGCAPEPPPPACWGSENGSPAGARDRRRSALVRPSKGRLCPREAKRVSGTRPSRATTLLGHWIGSATTSEVGRQPTGSFRSEDCHSGRSLLGRRLRADVSPPPCLAGSDPSSDIAPGQSQRPKLAASGA